MKVDDWLREATDALTETSPTARLDAEVLLAHRLGKDRSWLLAHLDTVLPDKIIQLLAEDIARRQKHVPIAYITGRAEFYGRTFRVSPDTLVPRPETETMLELLKVRFPELLAKNSDIQIVDVGTGNGAIAISAKLLFPNSPVYAIDISEPCLKIAKENAATHEAEVTFLLGDLLTPISQLLSPNSQLVVLANLPYVPDTHTINQAALQEPALAIFGGSDGLDLYRRLFEQINAMKLPLAHVFTEALPFQHDELARIANSHRFSQVAREDFIQAFENRN